MNEPDAVEPVRLMLLGGFTLTRGAQELEIPVSAQRLIALLALRERALNRPYLAGVLWPDCPAERSLADLRTTLWRANQSATSIVEAAGTRLHLRSEIQVDVRALAVLGCRATSPAEAGVVAKLAGISWFELSYELLPDWFDEWLVDDRERVRQLRLHALELLTAELSSRGRHGEAIQAALTAVTLAPLRETAHAALIKAHLTEGNWSEAVRQFQRYRALLRAELGIEPSQSLKDLTRVPACGLRVAGDSAGITQQ